MDFLLICDKIREVYNERKEYPLKDKSFQKAVYCIVIILSAIFIYLGHKIAVSGTDYKLLAGEKSDVMNVEAEILAIREEKHNELTGDREIYFSAKVKNTGDEVIGVQIVNENDPTVAVKPVEEGDKILMDCSIENQWQFTNYIRTNILMWLGAVFVALLLFFGRGKGVNTLVSLFFTCLAVFAVFVPAVIAGRNIYIWAIVICIYTILMTLLIVNGLNIKSVMAITGCTGGVIISGIITVIMNKLLNWNGLMDADTQRLILELPNIDLLGIIFASVTIGAMGAVMDVAMSMSSALHELKLKVGRISPSELYKSGMVIGRDMMGTMANTLVLAYIGSAMATTVLQILYNSSLSELLNKEKIIMEIMQALVGSLGILLTIPFTALICGIWYQKIGVNKRKRKPAVE